MKLAEYMKLNNMTDRRMADLIKVKAMAVNNYRRGLSAPRLDIAKRIETVTDGEVTIRDLRPDVAVYFDS